MTRWACRTSISAHYTRIDGSVVEGPSLSRPGRGQGRGARHRDQGPARRHHRQAGSDQDQGRRRRALRPADRRGQCRGQCRRAGGHRRLDRPDARHRARRGAAGGRGRDDRGQRQPVEPGCGVPVRHGAMRADPLPSPPRKGEGAVSGRGRIKPLTDRHLPLAGEVGRGVEPDAELDAVSRVLPCISV